MNQLSNQKLISISKGILLILRILFVILSLIAIIPLVAPSDMRGGMLMSLLGVLPIPGPNDMVAISLFSRGLYFIGSLINLLPLLIGTMIMIRLAKNYAIGKVFTLQNAKSYTILGIIYLSTILLNPLSQIFFSLAVSINNPVGQRLIYIHMDVNNLTTIFFAAVLIIIGQVMQFGHKINEEQELTV